MEFHSLFTAYGFYQNELQQNILPFWMPRCADQAYGGYINCFRNDGSQLVSYDKYTWSQGRFVWCFSRLASTEAPIFSVADRARFLDLARQGVDFLMRNCLIGKDDWRCVFLMNRDGTPKEVEKGAPLDMSIYADCFVIGGLGMYAFASGDMTAYRFAKHLYDSVVERVQRQAFHTLPYPLSPQYRAHGMPMILSNTTRELYRAAGKLAPADCPALLANLETYASDILDHFVDENNVLHEVITSDNKFFPQILGRHINPGHTIEDVWFLLDAADLCGKPEWNKRIYAVAKRALENGWDAQYGGLIHLGDMSGGRPTGDIAGVENEPMTRQLAGWSDKLWWVHAEALYSTLLCGFRSADPCFFDWYCKIFTYTFRVFPNPDREVREWVQIRTRNGQPEEKIVALPVKDPYHIMRNLILILELLHHQLHCEATSSGNANIWA
ncbi:MAG: AGE family epimerase/isomerase [Clostridia bacterium]